MLPDTIHRLIGTAQNYKMPHQPFLIDRNKPLSFSPFFQNFTGCGFNTTYYPWQQEKILPGVVQGVGCALLLNLYERRVFPKQEIPHFFHRSYTKFPRITLFAAVGVIPLVEETLFRGVFRQLLIENQENPYSTSSTMGRTALNASLFALCHIRLSGGWRYNLCATQTALVAGIVFSGLTEIAEGNLWGATIAHGLLNYLVLRQV